MELAQVAHEAKARVHRQERESQQIRGRGGEVPYVPNLRRKASTGMSDIQYDCRDWQQVLAVSNHLDLECPITGYGDDSEERFCLFFFNFYLNRIVALYIQFIEFNFRTTI